MNKTSYSQTNATTNKKKFTAIKYKNKNEIKIINRHASSAQNHLFIFHFRVAFSLLLLHG